MEHLKRMHEKKGSFKQMLDEKEHLRDIEQREGKFSAFQKMLEEKRQDRGEEEGQGDSEESSGGSEGG